MSDHCTVETHETMSPALRAEWLGLLTRRGWSTPFEHPDFVAASVAMSAGESCPMILTARAAGDGALRGILALGQMKQRFGPLRMSTLRSVSLHRHDLTTTLADAEWTTRVSRAFAAHLIRLVGRGLQVRVRGIPGSDPLLAELGEAWLFDLPSPLREADLRGRASWEAVILDGHQRREIGRAGRRLARTLGWDVHWAGTADESRAGFREFSTLHADQLARRGRANYFSSTTVNEALEALLAEWVPRGWADVGTLRLGDGTPIAAYILFHSDQHTWAYRTCFALEWGRHAPGALMLAAAVDRAIARGSERYDFGWGDQSYKRHWSTVVGTVIRLTTNPGVRQLPFRALSKLGVPLRTMCVGR